MVRNKAVTVDLAVELLNSGGAIFREVYTKPIHHVNKLTGEHIIEYRERVIHYIYCKGAHYNVRNTDIKRICRVAGVPLDSIQQKDTIYSVKQI